MTDTLRKLAEGATPGPWKYETGPAYGRAAYHMVNVRDSDDTGAIAECWDRDHDDDKNNARFIAAANPTAVIALLDEIDALRAKVKAQQEALKPFAEAWNIHSGKGEVCRHLSLAELGVLASYHVSAVHFRRAAQEAGND